MDNQGYFDQSLAVTIPNQDFGFDPTRITKAASKQTYYTVRFLVDRDRTDEAYRAYAYFRWVDDCLDQKLVLDSERIAFVERQKAIIEYTYQGEEPCGATAEEQMLVDLIRNDHEHNSGLQAYIRHMMVVMDFDAKRRGQLISQTELDEYSRHLAIAVTEALHYFIGHAVIAPYNEARYLAATAAHITHMLRDTYEDMATGYFNTPYEVLCTADIQPSDIASAPYRAWVKSRVALARTYFKAGKNYLAQVKNLRCRIAGYAYIARFDYVLNAIERENYILRPDYHERRSLSAGLGMGWSVLRSQFRKSSWLALHG